MACLPDSASESPPVSVRNTPPSYLSNSPPPIEAAEGQPNGSKGAGARFRAKLAKLSVGVRKLQSKVASITIFRAANNGLTNMEKISEYQHYALNTSIPSIVAKYFSGFSSPLLKNIECEMTPIYVGEGRDKFVVHDLLLLNHAKFFQGCLKFGTTTYTWKEGLQRKVELLEDEPAVFAMFVRYIYTGQCLILPDDKLLKVKGPDGKVETLLPGELLFHCYIFAEKMLALHFKSKIMDAILDKLTTDVHSYLKPFQTNADLLWDNLPHNSHLRALYIHVWARCGCEPWLHEIKAQDGGDPCNAPIEFWQELSLHLWHFRDNASNAHNEVVHLPTALMLDRAIKDPPWILDRKQYFDDTGKEQPAFPPLRMQQMVRTNLSTASKDLPKLPAY